MKTKLYLCFLLSAFGFSAAAADFTPGYTFSDVETDPNSLVTSNTLAQLVANATARTNFIADRTEATLSATNFWLLSLSTNGTLMKVAVGNLNPSNSIPGAKLASNSITADRLVTGSLTWTNLSTNWLEGMSLYSNLLVNLSTNGPGTNTYLLSAFSVNTGTNGYPTNLQFRLTPVASLTETASFSNAVNALAGVLVTNVVTNYYVGTNSTGLSTATINFAHGLGVKPSRVRAVLLCLTNDSPFLAGDEVNADGLQRASLSVANYSITANATNIQVRTYQAQPAIVTGVSADMSPATNSWRFKVYAWP